MQVACPKRGISSKKLDYILWKKIARHSDKNAESANSSSSSDPGYEFEMSDDYLFVARADWSLTVSKIQLIC